MTRDAQKLGKAFADVDDFMKAQFNSVCNQTMAGFVQNRSHVSTYQKHRIQCMYATKDWNNLYEKQVGGLEVLASTGALDASMLVALPNSQNTTHANSTANKAKEVAPAKNVKDEALIETSQKAGTFQQNGQPSPDTSQSNV